MTDHRRQGTHRGQRSRQLDIEGPHAAREVDDDLADLVHGRHAPTHGLDGGGDHVTVVGVAGTPVLHVPVQGDDVMGPRVGGRQPIEVGRVEVVELGQRLGQALQGRRAGRRATEPLGVIAQGGADGRQLDGGRQGRAELGGGQGRRQPFGELGERHEPHVDEAGSAEVAGQPAAHGGAGVGRRHHHGHRGQAVVGLGRGDQLVEPLEGRIAPRHDVQRAERCLCSRPRAHACTVPMRCDAPSHHGRCQLG